MELTITLDGVVRTYNVDDVDIFNKDWNEVLEDMLDSIKDVNEI